MKKFIKNEKGSVVVLVALYMTVMMGLLALVIDGGSLYLERSKLQKGVDLAVLAGMQNLPENPSRAMEAAEDVAYSNELADREVSIQLQDDGTSLYAEANRNVSFTFAKVLGFSDQDVSATAKAQVGSLSSVQGAIPLGAYGEKTFSFGDQIEMKVGPSSSDTSFLGALRLSNDYEGDLKRGHQGTLSVGDVVSPEPGNMARPTQRAIETRMNNCPYHQQGKQPTHLDHPDNCPLVVIVPIYREVTPGNFDRLEIVGFGSFFIDSVGRVNEGAPITGRFIRYAFSGEFSPVINQYGAYAYKLVE
ncbi:Tad domain-containing protein [Texcoconibacillus texcoconensis]|uniref:Flp pilus assembly protein TadG n=1 Tax=Texcoconibacillus texcoconensis TaxID=1095777 RepID=A0A840QQ49_9BACI|nr:Tad domain-containing protein [Texcoconibacillus texcoconensis]MBB5173479.1 Flp pilus assembly protein TadG [Texcoconibacillus texcoconensis]